MSEENYNITPKLNIVDYDPDELAGVVSSCGDKRFRAKQIFGRLAKGVESFDEMTNIPAKLRTALAERYYIDFLRPFWFRSLRRMVRESVYLNFVTELESNPSL